MDGWMDGWMDGLIHQIVRSREVRKYRKRERERDGI